MRHIPNARDRHLLRQFNLALGSSMIAIPSVRELASLLGFAVDMRQLPKGVSGYLTPDTFAEKGYAIVVNRSMSVVRQRWTVLHEMGHYYLHVLTKPHDPFAPQKNRESRGYLYFQSELLEEREANGFADALCFGDGALTATLSGDDTDVENIARKFGVSLSTIQRAISKYKPRMK